MYIREPPLLKFWQYTPDVRDCEKRVIEKLGIILNFRAQ